MRSSVDREGNVLRLQGEKDAAYTAARVVKIVDRMGFIAEPIATDPAVSRWFGFADVDELSQEEARVLADRWARALATEGVVEVFDRVIEPLRTALLEGFRGAARTGSVDEVHMDERALRAVLGEGEASQVRRWVDRQLRRPDSGS